MRRALIAALPLMALLSVPAFGAGTQNMTPIPGAVPSVILKAAYCKDYRTCEQAVRNWCAGNHPRADGDRDGIPCENVCRSRAQVVRIMKEIGCSR